MSIRLNNDAVVKIEQFIATDPIAKPNPPQRYETFYWEFRGKPIREFYNEIGGVRYSCDNVFLIDIDLLHYNFENRRIKIYLQEWGVQKRQNPKNFKSPVVSESNEEDITYVEDLLLDRNDRIIGTRPNTEGFERELIENGQQEPAVITADGTLRNGNRRKAIFHDILRKIRSGQKGYANLKPELFQYLKIIILPRVDEAALFDLENFLQTKRDWKQPYDAITELNIIKEARDKYEMAFEQINDKYLHRSNVKDVEVDYKKIKAIDDYLDMIGKPGQYRMVAGQQEMFEDFIKYSFKETGLATIPREKSAFKQGVERGRKEFFFDMVATNQINPALLRPSDKAVRAIAQEVFKGSSALPGGNVGKFYDGVDKTKLRQGETTNVERFGANVEKEIMSHQAINVDRQPIEKLKKIARDLNRFKPRAIQNLARKKEAGEYISLAKKGLESIEKEIAKAQK